MSKRVLSTWAAICVLAAAPAAFADVLTVISDRDNTLYEADPPSTGCVQGQGCPQSNGAGQRFFVGRTDGKTGIALRRGLLHFDLSSIPAGSSIDSVVLTLEMTMTISGPTPVSLHRATSDWGEGTSDAPGQEGGGTDATMGDATWFHTFFDSSFWTSVGGDFDASASATAMVDDVGSYSWGSTAGMEADVSAWVDNPGANFGWVVVGDEAPQGQGGGSTTKRFNTREFEEEGTTQPMLVVNFTLPVPVELQSFDID